MASGRPDDPDEFRRIKSEYLLFVLHLVRLLCGAVVAVATARWAAWWIVSVAVGVPVALTVKPLLITLGGS